MRTQSHSHKLHGTGPPFCGSAIPGIRVRVGLGLTLADLRNGGPPEWRTGIKLHTSPKLELVEDLLFALIFGKYIY